VFRCDAVASWFVDIFACCGGGEVQVYELLRSWACCPRDICMQQGQQQQLGVDGGPYLASSSAAGEVAFLVAAGIKGKARTVDKFFEEFFLRGFWR